MYRHYASIPLRPSQRTFDSIADSDARQNTRTCMVHSYLQVMNEGPVAQKVTQDKIRSSLLAADGLTGYEPENCKTMYVIFRLK